MKLLDFVIIKFTFCLVLGICLAHIFNIALWHSFTTTLILIITVGVLYLLTKNKPKKSIWFGLTAYLAMLSLGVLVYNAHDQTNFSNHYTHHLNVDTESPKSLRFKIRKVLKPSRYHSKYIVDLMSLDSNKNLTGKLLLNIDKDSSNVTYKIDDVFVSKTQLQPINPPSNPGQFNYKAYLKKQYVYHQLYLKSPELLKIDSTKHSLYGFAARLRTHINRKLKQSDFKSRELAIINALLLGQRQDIDRDTYNNYANAGAVHILAVSGLHVGIILILLQLLLKPLSYFKHGNAIRMFMIVVLLWCFAVVAGLSASVTRAVTMFSLVAIAINWKRHTNIYNTIAASIFLLLLFKPMFLFDVGFQLSYLAVLAIITIQPMLYKLWKPPNTFLDVFWNIFTVTLAAQFGVAPIGLYYFHQFPGLFFISNLAIIPCLGLILGFGILIIVLALCNALPHTLASAYGEVINWMNKLVEWVSQQESFLFKDVPLSPFQLIAYYFLIIGVVQFFKKRTYQTILMVLFGLIVLQASYFFNKFNNRGKAFTVFNKSRHTIIGQQQNRDLVVHHDLDSTSYNSIRLLKNYRINRFINNTDEDSLQSIYKLNDKFMLVVDSMGVYNVKSGKIDLVLLRQSPRINLNRLIDSLKPTFIIADGSNYRSYVERWEQTCLKRKLRFHHTSENGAFILE